MEKLTNVFKIEFTKGDTYALAIKFKNITEDLRLAYFSVKDNPDDAPLIQKSLGAGIDKIDDRGYKNEKTYKFQLQPADTINLEANVQYLYDIQVTVGNVVKTVLHGVFLLRNTITGTTAVTTQNFEVEVDDELETELLTTPATNGVEYEQDPVANAKIGDLMALKTTNKETVVQAVNEVKNGVTANAEDLNKIKNGTLKVPNAVNADKATNATNADGASNAGNLTSAINGIALALIFEEDGKTVKKATEASNATSADKIKSEVIFDSDAGVGDTLTGVQLLPYYRYVILATKYDVEHFLTGITTLVNKGDSISLYASATETTTNGVETYSLRLWYDNSSSDTEFNEAYSSKVVYGDSAGATAYNESYLKIKKIIRYEQII